MHGVTEKGNKKVFVVTAMGRSVYLSLLVFNNLSQEKWSCFATSPSGRSCTSYKIAKKNYFEY